MLRAVPLDRLDGVTSLTRGLTDDQVEARATRYGENHILEAAPGGWLRLMRETAKDPMLWFLLGTSVVFLLVGQLTEALILLAALGPLLGMDAYLHRRTHASIQGLSSRLGSNATVERGGLRQTIASTGIVPGDLVIVAAGEPFPADGFLVAGERIQVDESALTGESFPVRKELLEFLPARGAEVKVDSHAWGFAGTRLLAGEAQMRVVYIGGETLYGDIVRSATRASHTRTPLQSAVANLVTVLVVGAVLLCLTLAWVRFRQGHGLFDALLSAMTLAVAALPEEFPVVLTFFLGVGVYRLAKRQALVRRAVVVENIGRVSCICTDKTGTITQGQLRLSHRVPIATLSPERLLLLAAAASRRETGDPMDGAILDALERAPSWEVVASFPFTEDRKRETGILREDGRLLAAVKGAPEVVLKQCDLAHADRAKWQAQIDEFAGTAHKVIACAWRGLEESAWAGGEPDREFHLAGLLCFEDPVRPGVAEALWACQAAHIRVIMVTGDHAVTARAVAREIGLGGDEPRIIEGDQLKYLLEHGDSSILRELDVIARAVPAQKLDLVRTLQGEGHIVAVTGDGVNDVPALQAADIGIAMGGRGTRSAREVAAIVLLDDNFSSIVHAIAEGRQLFSNLRLSFQYLLMIHLPLVFTAALIPLAGYPVLYLPIHIVWLELIIHPTALLVFQELPSDHNLAPARRRTRLRFFDVTTWVTIAAVAALIATVITVSYVRGLGSGYDVGHARAIALVVLTTASATITVSLSRMRSRTARMIVAGTLLMSVLLVQTPALSQLLHLTPLHLDDWMLAVGGGVLAALLSATTAARLHSTRARTG